MLRSAAALLLLAPAVALVADAAAQPPATKKTRVPVPDDQPSAPIGPTLGIPLPPPAPPPAVGPARGLDVVPRDVFAFATADVGLLWDHPTLAPVRKYLTVAPGGDDPFARLLGVGPGEIDRVTAFATHPDALDEMLVVVVTTKQPYAPARVRKNLGVTWNGPDTARRHGNVLVTPDGPFSAVVLADDRTLVYLVTSRFGRDPGEGALVVVGKLLGRAADGPLAAALADAPKHAACAGMDVSQLVEMFERSGARPDATIRPLLKARTAVFTADLDGSTLKARLVVAFPTPADAAAAAPVVGQLVEQFAGQVDREAKRQAEQGEMGAAAVILYRWLSWTLTTANVRAEGANVVVTVTAPVDEMIAKLMAKLPASIEAGATAARASNNLKQIALALHTYHDATGRFPGYVHGPDGKPQLSWRVQVLPYLEEGPLSQQVRMTEPWDSPANKALLDRMPAVFQMPGRPAPKGETYFRTFIGPRGGQHRPWLTEGDRFGPQMVSITDGTSNTLMVVEAGESVPWTKPDDLPYDGTLPLPKLGDGGRFLAAFADGSVRSLPTKNETYLRALITIQGGEVAVPDR